MAEVLTIGAYGWTESAFFGALERERVSVFCDVRRRRGVRGSEYAFVNSQRLQRRLAELEITYVHRLDLAPSAATREAQRKADVRAGVAKRDRAALGDAFAAAYVDECLAAFNADGFLSLAEGRGRICLFCVERLPEACHRSLVAGHLEAAGTTVRHLVP